MKKWLALVGLMIFATPALAVDEADLFAVGATHFSLDTTSHVSSGVVGGFGTYLRVACTVSCWMALSSTDFQGTFGVDSTDTAAYHIQPETPVHMKPKGEKYIIYLGFKSGKIYITELTP